MPAASYVNIGGSSVFFAQLSYFPDLVSLFSEADFHENVDTDTDTDTDAYSFYGYVSSAWKIRQRLTVLGGTAKVSKSALETAVFSAATEAASSTEEGAENSAEFPVQPLTAPEVLRRAHNYLHWETSYADGLVRPEPYEDPRIFEKLGLKHHFRLLLDLVPDEARVELDLTRLKNDTCCYALPADLATDVHAEQHADMSTSLPLLVLTEGSTDARALGESVKVTHPHLVDFLKFMDFDFNPDGGVGGLVRSLKALVAAGIPNRIVAIADNDAAAREALPQKFVDSLPSSVKVIHYPHLDSLRSYPAYDVEGNIVELDINGRAGSIEMYFGSDVLECDGERPPVRWTGHQQKAGTYQGVVSSKNDLGKKFHQKVKSQLEKLDSSPEANLDGDWEGMRSIIETIVRAFD